MLSKTKQAASFVYNVEERISMSINISEKIMEYFLKNLDYVIVL